MSILQAAVLCIIGSILCLFLRKIEPSQAALLGLGVLALVLLSSASQLTATTVLIYNCFFTLIYILFTLFRK